MLFEDIILALLGVSAIFFIGLPLSKLVRRLVPEKRNPLQEARERLEQARLEAEAARLNKEAEKMYENIYEETLQDEENKQENSK